MDARSIALRRKIIDVMAESRCGHIKSAFSCLEIVRVLYDDILKPDDKFILSKGHGCLAQYVLLNDKGIISDKELFDFCKEGALLGGHPSHKIPGVEVSTGSLGHGLPIGVGFALAGHRTFVLMGDGECNEGSVWESIRCAAKHNIGNLIVLEDHNGQQSYGSIKEVSGVIPIITLLNSFNWYSNWIMEGHDCNQILAHLSNTDTNLPKWFTVNTVKGKGIKFVEDDPRWHYKGSITDDEIKSLYEGLEKYEKDLL